MGWFEGRPPAGSGAVQVIKKNARIWRVFLNFWGIMSC